MEAFSSPSLDQLPDEVLLYILSYLSVYDLLQCSRTCHVLRSVACDPILHSERLQWASRSLELALEKRPTRASLSPPNAWIWLSRTNVLSRSINKSLIKIRIAHNLDHRPSFNDLVAKAIMPPCPPNLSPVLVQNQRAIERNRLKTGLGKKLQRRPSKNSLVYLNILPEESITTISPGLVERRRRVIKEDRKDGLRAWVQSRGLQAQRRRAMELEDTERITVKALVRRFTARKLAQDLEDSCDPISLEKKRAQARWGRALEIQTRKEERRIALGENVCAQPTRAHVLGLRRFWEGAVRTATI